jgi:DNA-binding transcriptional regulator YiaG
MYDSDDEARSAVAAKARELLAHIDALRPVAKVRVDSARDEHRFKSHAAWLEAVQACRDEGMSQNALIARLGVDVRTFIDWKEGKRQIPAWAVTALPAEGRMAYARALIVPSESQRLGRVG